MEKLPWFRFYPGDWKKDQNLSRASKGAKGVFIDAMCLAFECEKRGVFMTDKKPWSIEEIAYAIGGDMNENLKFLNELLMIKVLKKNKKNAIYQSRMVKDEKVRKVKSDAGLRGGNPSLLKQEVKQKVNQVVDDRLSIIVRSQKSESDIFIKKEEKEKWIFRPTQFFDLTQPEINQTHEYIFRVCQTDLSPERLKDFWIAFQTNEFTGENFYQTRSRCLKHFRDWLKFRDLENKKSFDKTQQLTSAPLKKLIS